MTQPNWELVRNLGDSSFADYGGSLLYRDTTGVYCDELEHYDASDNETGGEVYRILVEPVTYVNGILSDNKFHLDYPVWWSTNGQLGGFLSSINKTKAEFILEICGEDKLQVAVLYDALATHFGWFEFDQYPRTITELEAQERYKDIPRH